MKRLKEGEKSTLASGSNRCQGGKHKTIDIVVEENKNFIKQTTKIEVDEKLKKSKQKKAISPNNIIIEVWKCSRHIKLNWFTSMFNEIWRTKM